MRLGTIRTALAYEGSGARMLRRFKFDGRRDGLALLLPPLVERLHRLSIDTVVPIPRHRSRVRSEGSEPTVLLARRVARALGVRLAMGALERRRATRLQTGLSPRERRLNVSGAFRALPGSLSGRRVLLLDDVATTGATLGAARRELLERSGARYVLSAALAGTPALSREPELAL